MYDSQWENQEGRHGKALISLRVLASGRYVSWFPASCLLGFLAHCLKDNVFKKTKPKKEEEEEGEGKEEEEEGEGGEKKEFLLSVFPRA